MEKFKKCEKTFFSHRDATVYKKEVIWKLKKCEEMFSGHWDSSV